MFNFVNCDNVINNDKIVQLMEEIKISALKDEDADVHLRRG